LLIQKFIQLPAELLIIVKIKKKDWNNKKKENICSNKFTCGLWKKKTFLLNQIKERKKYDMYARPT
jgi:hypothetical protein